MSDRPPTSLITDKPYWQAYVVGTILLIISAILWWTQLYTGTKAVFWNMIDTSLKTSSFVTETSQSNGEDSFKQLTHTDLRAGRVQSLTILKQSGAEVKTEVVGTKDVDYTRYISIVPNKKDAAGNPVAMDTSSVLNVWSKSDETAQSETQASGHQLFAQATLGLGLPIGSVPVPVGNLEPKERQTFVRQIRSQNMYEPNFKTVKKERKDGRLLYTYEVKVQTISYVRLMQAFAKQIGLKELEKVDANTYSSAEPLVLKMTVDAHSHQLVRVENAQGYVQEYKSYGLPLKATEPKQDVISSAELQRRLSELEKH